MRPTSCTSSLDTAIEESISLSCTARHCISNSPRHASRPLQPRKDGRAHEPVLVALGQEGQLFGDMSDALPPGRLGECSGDIGSPIAAARPISIEHPAQMLV